MMRAFFDTNILIYLFDEDAPEKKTIAQKLFEKGVNIIGIPKTINNDLSITDFTFGFLYLSMDKAAPYTTACVIIIGNEILSGRTQDLNLSFIGKRCDELGIRLMEARVIPDVEEVIINEEVIEGRADPLLVYSKKKEDSKKAAS